MENEENNSQNSLYYNYPIKDILNKDVNNITYLEEIQNINLCVYTVNTEGKYPFLQYLLQNNGLNCLIFPTLSKYILYDVNSLVPYSIVYLSGLLQTDSFEHLKNEICFDGFYEYENELYLFFDVTKCNNNLDEIYSNSARFGLIDEIINQKKICNIPIDYAVVKFFINNISLSYLYDKLNQVYELPIVGYIGKHTEHKLKFTSIFGESAKDKTAILGPYFYFTDFKNSINRLKNYNPQSHNNPGIVRFALFTGSTKFIENNPNSNIDESLIKKQRLEDESLNLKNEHLTLKITDHDGLWAKSYDSIFLNDIELDDGSFLIDVPMFVLREYEQQIPLTYHYVNVNTLLSNNNENNINYCII